MGFSYKTLTILVEITIYTARNFLQVNHDFLQLSKHIEKKRKKGTLGILLCTMLRNVRKPHALKCGLPLSFDLKGQ